MKYAFIALMVALALGITTAQAAQYKLLAGYTSYFQVQDAGDFTVTVTSRDPLTVCATHGEDRRCSDTGIVTFEAADGSTYYFIEVFNPGDRTAHYQIAVE
jgi:hypothetical protein